jgi:hypothetical protein
VQQRFGADKLPVVLINVDSGYFANQEEFLPQAKKILNKQNVDWPNAITSAGFNDVFHVFNLSGYGNIVVDAKGIVRGVNVAGTALENLIEEIIVSEKTGDCRK